MVTCSRLDYRVIIDITELGFNEFFELVHPRAADQCPIRKLSVLPKGKPLPMEHNRQNVNASIGAAVEANTTGSSGCAIAGTTFRTMV